MMRRSLFRFVFPVIVCYCHSAAHAQYGLTLIGPTPAPTLVAKAQGQSLLDSTDSESPSQSIRLDNPFDFFSEAVEKNHATNEVPPLVQDNSSRLDSPTSTSTNKSIIDSDSPKPESSRPVGSFNNAASPADQIVAGARAISSHNFPTADWASYSRRTPNPVANYMTQQWCVDGLWDSFAAERAAQCARQAQRIAHERHGGCGCNAGGGCGQQGICGSGGLCGQYTGHAGHFPHCHLNRCRGGGYFHGQAQNHACNQDCGCQRQMPECGCGQADGAHCASHQQNGHGFSAEYSAGPYGRPAPQTAAGQASAVPVPGRVAHFPQYQTR